MVDNLEVAEPDPVEVLPGVLPVVLVAESLVAYPEVYLPFQQEFEFP